MAWNPKTVAGKLLKTAVGVGGTVLGTVTGVNLLGGTARAVGKVIETGTKVLTKGKGVLDNMRVVSDRVADSAKDLASGYTKEVNALNKATKEKLRSEVSAAVGDYTYTNSDGIETTVKKQAITDFLKSDGVKYAAIGLAALFILPKLFKK